MWRDSPPGKLIDLKGMLHLELVFPDGKSRTMREPELVDGRGGRGRRNIGFPSCSGNSGGGIVDNNDGESRGQELYLIT